MVRRTVHPKNLKVLADSVARLQNISPNRRAGLEAFVCNLLEPVGIFYFYFCCSRVIVFICLNMHPGIKQIYRDHEYCPKYVSV